MDEAVASAPRSLEVRFVRGATERELPGFFGRKQQAKEDIQAVVQNPKVTEAKVLEPRLAAASFYYYGMDCLDSGRRDEAANAMRKSVDVAPDSRAGQDAARKLKALP